MKVAFAEQGNEGTRGCRVALAARGTVLVPCSLLDLWRTVSQSLWKSKREVKTLTQTTAAELTNLKANSSFELLRSLSFQMGKSCSLWRGNRSLDGGI